MSDFIKDLNKATQSIQLDQTKKAELRNELIRFMNEHPVKEAVGGHSIFVRTFAYFRIHRTAYVPLVACAILILGAGTSYAAAGSLPGDVLYPVKVHVNEEVQAALITDSDQKADFEITRAETRLAEADDLAAAGRLKGSIKAQVEANLNANTEKVQNRIKKLEDSGSNDRAADLAVRLEASLNAHRTVLSAIDSNNKNGNDSDKNEVSDFAKGVASTAVNLGDQRQALDLKISGQDDNQQLKDFSSGKIKAAQNIINEVKSYIALKSQTGSVTADAANQQLDVAVKTLADAQIKFDGGKFSDSFKLASTAQRQALQAKALVKLEIRLPEKVQKALPNVIRQDGNNSGGAGEEHGSRHNDESGFTPPPNENLISSPQINSLPKLNF